MRIVSIRHLITVCLLGLLPLAGHAADILKLGNGAEPEDIDPARVTGVVEHKIIIAVTEGLVSRHPKGDGVLPGVAESWQIADGGSVYQFTLRDDAVWSNGDAVTAEDFVFSFQRMLDPALGAENAYMYFPIKNAKAYYRGEVGLDQVGIEAVDSRTLVIELEHPTAYFLELLAHHAFYPVHPPTVRAFGGDKTIGTRWTRPENFVSNGPFLLETWSPNNVLTVKKNPNYWDADNVLLDGIEFYPYDSATEERAFRAGQLHVTESLPLSRVRAYERDKDPRLQIDPYLGTYYYVINTRVAPLDNKLVRQALAKSLRRDIIAEKIVGAGRTPAYSFVPPKTARYEPGARMEDNFARGRRLMRDAGFPGGKGIPTIEILYNSSDDHKRIAQVVQQMWKTLGIEASLNNQEWKVYLESRKTGNFMVARAGWIGDYNDPNSFLDLWTSSSGNNHSGWSNAEYDELVFKAQRTSDPKERLDLYQRAEAILLDEAPVIPIYFYTKAYLKDPRVKGWYANLLGIHPYKGVSID